MMDTQTIEIIGRNRLIDELLRAGLEVALPLRDRGIDLIAYADVGAKLTEFVACPIQMKASSGRSFSIHRKYEKFLNLIHAFVWGLGSSSVAPATYALTQQEAIAVAQAMGYTLTPSWQDGNYTTQQPSKKLLALLEPYRMTPAAWWLKITKMQSAF